MPKTVHQSLYAEKQVIFSAWGRRWAADLVFVWMMEKKRVNMSSADDLKAEQERKKIKDVLSRSLKLRLHGQTNEDENWAFLRCLNDDAIITSEWEKTIT